MEKVFLDSDVLVDVLSERQPFLTDSERVLKLGEVGEIKIYTSTLVFANIYYVLRKITSRGTLIANLNALLEIMDLLSVDESVVKIALNSNFSDFEDALQYFSIEESRHQITTILTRNIKDFKASNIPVFTPREYLVKFIANQ